MRRTAALGYLKTASLVLPLLVLLAACSADPKAVSRKYVDRGNKYFAQRKYKEASILYRRALNKDLRSPDAWYRLGLVNTKLGVLPEARKDFSRAMGLDPANQDAVVQLGDLDLAFYLLDPGNWTSLSRGSQGDHGAIVEAGPAIVQWAALLREHRPGEKRYGGRHTGV